ncbi:hypothetical protein LSUE1_G001233 [Lachnellula suecica]|uniref:Uncharacterized protein n=1 Tax=Lachnellula suecica TaxID=602035 RepID=A0A8T9CCT5_9HELO|nr:hypothetical protein LSUE1_G001233 [Lachnellula suecica]
MAQVEHADLWMERNNCYAHLVRELFGSPPTRNYKFLSLEMLRIEMRGLWLASVTSYYFPPQTLNRFLEVVKPQVNGANFATVEYVKRAGNWEIVGDGVFTRQAKDMVPENPNGGDEANATLSVNPGSRSRAHKEADSDD